MSAIFVFNTFRVELSTVLRRRSGLVALLVSAIVGVFAVVAMGATQNMATSGSVTVQGADLSQMVTVSGPDAAAWALRIRHFFVLPMLLLLATAGAFAGELADHTMRERLVRAVPRWLVLLVKLSALWALSALSLIATFVLAIVGGVVRFGVDGPWQDLLLAFVASAFSDLGVIALGLLLATLFRGAAGVVVGGLMVLLADFALRMLLTFLGYVGLQEPAALIPFLPGSALACWQGMDHGWSMQPFLALGVFVSLCLGFALVRFQRMDIP